MSAGKRLIELILDAPQEGFAYSAELYTLSDYEDILATKTRDDGKADGYLLRRYDDVYVLSRMRYRNLLIPVHLLLGGRRKH